MPSKAPAQPDSAAIAKAKAEATAAATVVAAAEQTRILAIQRFGHVLESGPELIAEHVKAGTSAEVFNALATDKFAEAKKSPIGDKGRPPITAGADEADKHKQLALNWLLHKSNAAKHGVKVVQEFGEFGGCSLMEMARLYARRNGRPVESDKMKLLKHSFLSSGGAGQGVDNFPVLIDDFMHQRLLAEWTIAADKWRRFCDVGSVGDFRPHHRYRTGGIGDLSKLNENGEYTRITMSDGRREEVSVDTYGNIFAVTRKLIINDNLGAISRGISKLLRASNRTIETLVFLLLAENGGLGPNMSDNNPLYHASHQNVGPGAALSRAAVFADQTKIMEQTDEGTKDVLDDPCNVLLIPTGLRDVADLINTNQTDPDDPDSHVRNTQIGVFDDIVATSRLSGTRRYYFKSGEEVIEVSFLDNQQMPVLESREGWKTDGTETKIRMDVGVGAVDFKKTFTDAGS